jgi:hypothetical protein
MLLRLVGGRRGVGASAGCVGGGVRDQFKGLQAPDKPEAPTARTPSTGCARGTSSTHQKSPARV